MWVKFPKAMESQTRPGESGERHFNRRASPDSSRLGHRTIDVIFVKKNYRRHILQAVEEIKTRRQISGRLQDPVLKQMLM
jgi:hypothetical protein